MTTLMLTQMEANELISMKKKFENKKQTVLNESFEECFNLISENKQEHFVLDMKQGKIDLKKIKYQNRFDEVIPLVRFESKGIHENPDGTIIKGPHIHIYKEGYGDKFAVPSPFNNPEDVLESIKQFCKYCNIEETNFTYQSINIFPKNKDNKNEN